jgi:cobalt-zinc-cadmium efflux system outer membrane protein
MGRSSKKSRQVRWAVVVVLAVVAVGVPAAAEDARARPVTLGEVIAAAGRAPAAQVTSHEIAAAEALVDSARAWPNPSLRVETNRLTARLVAGATVPLPVFGTVGATTREAAARAEAVRAQAIVDQRDLRRRAVAAWIALARADGEVTASAIAATQAAEIERIARGRLDAGVGAEVDVTTARAARARAELAATAANRAQEATSAELAGVLGWDPLQQLEASGALPAGHPIALEALMARLANHPERTVATRRLAAANATVAQVRAQRLPGLALEGQVSIDDPTQAGTDVLVALSLELPVFARIGDRARSASATAAAERARLAVTEAELGAGLVAAYRRWQAATEQLAGLEKEVVPAQERAAALSAQAYREGARDLASALQADRDLAAVRAEVNAARADAATAWAELQLASGEELRAR